MALFDASLEFSDDQSLISTNSVAATAASNTYNFSDTTQELSGLEIGAGNPMWLNVRVGTSGVIDGTTDSASTITVALVNEADTTIDASSRVMYQSRAFTQAEMTAGSWLVRVPLPNDIDGQPYMGVLYTSAGAAVTAGSVNAWIDNGPQSSHDTQVSASNI